MKRFIPTCIALMAVAWATGPQAAGLFDDEGLSEGEVQASSRKSGMSAFAPRPPVMTPKAAKFEPAGE